MVQQRGNMLEAAVLRIAVALCLCLCVCVCLPSRGEWAAAEIVVDGVSAHDPATTLYKTAKKLYAKGRLDAIRYAAVEGIWKDAHLCGKCKGPVARIDVDERKHLILLSEPVEELAKFFHSSMYLEGEDARLSLEAYFSRLSRNVTAPCIHTLPSPPRPIPEGERRLSVIVQATDRVDTQSWILSLLGRDNVEVIMDGRFRIVRNYALVVYAASSCEYGNHELLPYLKRFDRRRFSYALLHLHDERISGCRVHYPMANVVFRNVGHDHFAETAYRRNVLEIPIGFADLPGLHPTKPKDILARKHWLAFMGDQTKFYRPMMKVAIDGLGIPQRSTFLHYTDRWKDSKMMSPKDYASVLSDTIFALSPVGNSYASAGRDSGLGAFRTWEALLMGAIPVIENHTGMPGTNWQYLGRYGVLNTPLPTVKKDWSNLAEVLQPFLFNPDALQSLWLRVHKWYRQQIRRSRLAVRRALDTHLWSKGHLGNARRSASASGYCTIFCEQEDAYVTARCREV